MADSFTANGITYNDSAYDAGSNPKGFANAGHRKNLFPAAKDILADATTGLKATSATSLSITVASKVFVMDVVKEIAVGAYVQAINSAANWMYGQVTARSGANLTVNVTQVAGSGTLASWTIHVVPPQQPAIVEKRLTPTAFFFGHL